MLTIAKNDKENCFMSRTVTIAGERLQNFDLYLVLRAVEQEGIFIMFIMSHLLWHRTSVFPVSIIPGMPHAVASYDTPLRQVHYLEIMEMCTNHPKYDLSK
jgi:hypothetical protein